MASPARFWHNLNPPVFIGSATLILGLVSYTSFFPEQSALRFVAVQDTIMTNASWFYVVTVAIILIGVVYICLSRYGDIKLGPDHSEPDFSFSSWFAMLFSAGMGVGLMFFGVGEPVIHFLAPPVGEPGTIGAAKEAMDITFFHWGFHAWAIYAIVALILAFFGYRHHLPLTLRSALYPLVGDRIRGPVGHMIDIFAILCTTFGVATALGYGVFQVNSGLNYLFGIAVSTNTQVVLILAITALATLSVASGLDKGIRRLSELNLLLAVLLMMLIVILGPTILLLKMSVQNLGSYLSDLVNKTFNLYAYQSNDWLGGWTMLYWAWWLSWSPFVGMFIARISRGRTIREFICGVLFVPSGMTFLWMTIFGNTSIDLIMHHGAMELGEIVQADVSLALFKFLEYFPLSSLLSGIATVMVIVFFVTSSDSSAMVLDILSSKQDQGKFPVWQRVFWSFAIGLVALVLLLAGGLQALQAVTIASALPFAIVLLISSYGLLRALAIDAAKRESLAQTSLVPSSGHGHLPWQSRLRNVIHFPARESVHHFMENTVRPAMDAVAQELNKQGAEASIETDNPKIPALVVHHGEEQNFFYRVKPRAYLQPSFVIDDENEEEHQYYRAEVFLSEGGQDYDIMGWTKDQVISDIIEQYEKHMYFLHMVRE